MLKHCCECFGKKGKHNVSILLTSEKEAKTLAGCILSAKSVRMQTEYMCTQRTKITLHGVPVDTEDDLVGAFFTE